MTIHTLALTLLLSIGAMVMVRDAAAFDFGACVHLALGRSNAETVLQHLDAAGLTSLRDDVYWSGVERAPGVLQMPPKYDQLKLATQGLAQRSKSALLILDFGNQFYDNGGLINSPAGIQAFARYTDFVVRSFGDSVQKYEVWNEWNSGFGSNPKATWGDPAAYVRLLAEASKAIKQANPRALVVGGSTSGVDLKWLREFIAADGLRHVDAISVHSYTVFRFRENPEGAINSLDRLRAILVQASPAREIPIYVTEMGFPTHTGKYGVSERAAAKYLARFMMLARARPWIGGVWWYDLFDDGDSSTAMEQRFGLVGRDLRRKPAYLVAQRISPLLLANTTIESYRTQSGAYVVTGTDNTGRWATAWSMETNFLDWIDGRTTEPVAPAAFEPLASRVSPDGFPILFREVSGAWKADEDWMRENFSQVSAPPSGIKIQR